MVVVVLVGRCVVVVAVCLVVVVTMHPTKHALIPHIFVYRVKLRESKQKDGQVRQLRAQKKKATAMKHEIESLKSKQCILLREYTKKDRSRRTEINKYKNATNKSNKMLAKLKRYGDTSKTS